MKAVKVCITLSMLVGLLGCSSIPIAENAATLNVDFEWSDKSGCSRVSPQIRVGGIPDETQYLKVKLTDLNVPNYPHGGGEVSYEGNETIPEGALKSYEGPCPPGGSHDYEFSVQALNGERNLILGEGKKVRQYPQ